MGGSTSINAMTYLRGSSKDFDGWADDGNVGWDYKSMLTYMKKVENYEGVKTKYSGK